MEEAKLEKESQRTTTTGVSFGFNKTIVKKTLETSVIGETEKIVSDKEIIADTSSLKQKKEEKLVIPVKPGKWNLEKQIEKSRVGSKQGNQPRYAETGDEVTDAAVKEILTEASLNENSEKRSIAIVAENGDTNDPRSHIKMGQVMDEERDIEDEDYEKIPVQEFGLAMLRGMGWKDDEDSAVKPYEVRPRPVGLGLGVNVPTHSAAYGVKRKTENKMEEKLMLKPGAYCQVLKGKLEGQYGTVTSIEEDTVRVYVTMAISGEVVSLSQYAIQLTTKAEYDKEHRYINKKSVEKYKSEHQTSKTNGVNREETEDRSKKYDDKERRRRKEERKRRKEDDDDKEQWQEEDSASNRSIKSAHRERDERSPKKSKHTSSRSWVHPCLRVRFVDEKYKHGKYFKTKLVIIDVISKDLCICRTENGHLLEDIREDQLETVIPHDRTSLVMIVAGSHRSQLAEILEKDKKLCKAAVQLLPDKDEVITLDYDSICEYVGDID